MGIIYWSFIIVCFVIAYAALVYPILPGVLFLLGGFILYGVLFSFEPFSWLFWLVQGMFVILLFGADYVANLIGVKKYGGSKAGIWGSTIGLIAGPFVIPVLGIIIGPFLGAFIAELLVNRKSPVSALKVGFGSVLGFISSVFAKGLIQTVMILYFFFSIN